MFLLAFILLLLQPLVRSDHFSWHSSRSCFGETPTLRSCLFHNVYYNGSNQQFTYLENPRTQHYQKVSGQQTALTDFTASTDDGDPYFVSTAFIAWPRFVSGKERRHEPLKLNVVRSLKPLAHAYEENGLVVFWRFAAESGWSYGHCMLHEWLPLHMILSFHLQFVPASFQIISKGAVAPVCARYLSQYSGNQVLNSTSYFAKLDPSRSTWPGAEKRVLFRHVILGDAGYSTLSQRILYSRGMPSSPSMFATDRWLAWRDSVYTKANLALPVIPMDTQPLIIFNRRPDTRRHVINRDKVADALQAAFGHSCRVVYTDMTRLNYTEQLQLLQHAAVMVTTQGSHAFRYMLMPSGARVVLIGNPAVHAHDVKPASRRSLWSWLFGPRAPDWNWTPWYELPRYFSVSYIKFIKYVVPPDAIHEYVIPHTGAYGPHWDAWNADVHVNITRLLPLVAQALDECLQEVAWLQQGSMQLHAPPPPHAP